MDDVAAFLSNYPPFDSLLPPQLDAAVAASTQRSVKAGESLLVEDGPPADTWFVVLEGSLELVHQEEVIDVLEPGDGVGHPSLLTGMAPAFTVRSHEDSVVLAIPRETAISVLARPESVGYVAVTLRQRLTRTGHTVHGVPEIRTAHVGPLVDQRTPKCDAQATIREVARAMTEAHASAALVMDGDLGIVTDADLRAKVIAGDVSVDDPVSAIAAAPAPTVRTDDLAVETMIDMLTHGHDHVAVKNERGQVLGTISAHDLVGLEARSPFAVRRAILAARDEDEVAEACSRLPKLFLALVDAELRPADIGRVLTLAQDAAVLRLIDFSIEKRGQAPVAWAWLALGSGGRRELALGSDQDNLLAYADTDDPGVDEYFAGLADDVNTGLARAGWPDDRSGVFARDPRWRKTASTWVSIFRECLLNPDRSGLVRAAIAFDFRRVAGSLGIVGPLVEVIRSARRYPDFLRAVARTATDWRPPLGFLGSLVLERDGGGSKHLDIKKGGLLPIENLARFHALSAGVTISPTVDRLVACQDLGVLKAEDAKSLRQAFDITANIRLHHHASQVEAGRDPDNHVDPDELPPLTRRQLRDAFRTIAAAQKRLGVYVPIGI